MNVFSSSMYYTPLSNSPLLPLLLISLSVQKNAPDTRNDFKREYDYIVVGAGSAGATVASRLSEVDCVTVLLLEAGGAPPILSDVPDIQQWFVGTDLDWKYESVPQRNTGYGLRGRRVRIPRGKALGGSSALNSMIYVRGNRANYDDWEAKEGATGWSYDDVLPYFIKMEDNRNPEYVDQGYHGFGGPQTVERPKYRSEIQDAIWQAAKSLGYPLRDANGRFQTGFYDYQATIRNGQRCSTAKAYLVPAENRTNLDIMTKAHVTKIVIEDRTATGVEFDYEGKTRHVRAKRQVILSAGAINSPQLLMLSGIGPRRHLEDMGIPVLADLQVGSNLQDHCGAFVVFELDHSIRPTNERIRDPRNIRLYIDHRAGILSTVHSLTSIAFLSNGGPHVTAATRPDHQLFFLEGPYYVNGTENLRGGISYEEYLDLLEKRTVVWCMSSLLNTRSRGTVRLNSSDPYDYPQIDPNYFDHPQDLTDVLEGMKHCRDILSSEPFRKLGSRPITDPPFLGCEDYVHDQEKYYECSARTVITSVFHQCGTAKMGDPTRKDTVVDPELRVVGINNLRVVDASVMPTIVSGNTNAPVIMIAEKASDIIKRTINCF